MTLLVFLVLPDPRWAGLLVTLKKKDILKQKEKTLRSLIKKDLQIWQLIDYLFLFCEDWIFYNRKSNYKTGSFTFFTFYRDSAMINFNQLIAQLKSQSCSLFIFSSGCTFDFGGSE